MSTAENIVQLVSHRKTCSVCGETKDISAFYVRKSGKVPNECKACEITKNKERKQKNMNLYPMETREKWNNYKKKSMAYNRDYYLTVDKNQKYVKKYGITLDDAKRMLESQQGLCANRACGKEIVLEIKSSKSIAACVDHSHETGAVRGLLCNYCNMVLGHLENKNMVLGLGEYLHRFGRKING